MQTEKSDVVLRSRKSSQKLLNPITKFNEIIAATFWTVINKHPDLRTKY
jgi:hypothetical protein